MDFEQLEKLRQQYAKKLKSLANKDSKRKASKYKNEIVKKAGYVFHSKGEANCYDTLLMFERGGSIRDLKCQVSVHLSEAKILYVADFSFINCKTNELEFAEYKGFETPEWKIKKKLWKFYGPGKLTIYYPSRDSEIIIPKLP